MIKTSIEKLAEEIGFDIGASDDISQSNLINGFCRAYHDSMPDTHKRNMQTVYVVDKLTPTSIKIIKEIAGFIEHSENEIP